MGSALVYYIVDLHFSSTGKIIKCFESLGKITLQMYVINIVFLVDFYDDFIIPIFWRLYSGPRNTYLYNLASVILSLLIIAIFYWAIKTFQLIAKKG